MRKYRLGRGQPWSRWGPGGQTDSSRDWAIDRRQEVCWLAVYISFHFAGQPPPETGPVTPSPTSESSLIKPDKGGDALEGYNHYPTIFRVDGHDVRDLRALRALPRSATVSETSRSTAGSSAATKSGCGLGFSGRCDWLAAQLRSGAGGDSGRQ